MKILLVAKPWKGGLGHYIFLALNDLFPGQVEWLKTRPKPLSEQLVYRRGKKAWNNLLLDRLVSSRFDVALFINPLAIFEDLPRQANTILWLTDGPQPQQGELSSFGRVFVTDAGYKQEILSVVGPERFGGDVSFGFCPQVHAPVSARKNRKDLCFIGNRDAKRDGFLEELFRIGIRPTIVGNYFFNHSLFWRYPHCFRPPVANSAMGGIYASHQVSLNIHADVVREGTNMRTFECAAYGIPQLVEYRPGLEKFFDLEKEISVFQSFDEMVEKLRRFSRVPESAGILAKRARKRVLAEHTYFHRVAALFEDVLPKNIIDEKLAAVIKRNFG